MEGHDQVDSNEMGFDYKATLEGDAGWNLDSTAKMIIELFSPEIDVVEPNVNVKDLVAPRPINIIPDPSGHPPFFSTN